MTAARWALLAALSAASWRLALEGGTTPDLDLTDVPASAAVRYPGGTP